jgi:hypothetical protein
MKIEWNKVTWYSKLAAVILGVAILLLGMYIGSAYQKGKDAIEWAEQMRVDIQIPAQKVAVQKNEKGYAFEQEGNIKNSATGAIEMDEWVLIYEKAGAPALTTNLMFTTKSRCIISGSSGLCNTAEIQQGQRVRITGYSEKEGEVIVEKMEAVQ